MSEKEGQSIPFFSGDLSEAERLRMLDDPESVAQLIGFIKSPSLPSKNKKEEEPEKKESKLDKIERLLIAGETEFATELLHGSKGNFIGYEKLLEGGRIDGNGRPWPSAFCTKVKDAVNWDWQEEKEKWYQLFGILVECCPSDSGVDLSLQRIDYLNLAETGSEGFFNAIDKFPYLISLSVKKNHPNLSSKCPNLQYLDFRRAIEPVTLSVLSDCTHLSEINLMYSKLENLSDLPPLPKLRRINLGQSWSLEEIDSIPELESLEELELADCSSLVSLGDLSRFPSLSKLNLLGCKNLKLPDNLEELALSDLQLPESGNED